MNIKKTAQKPNEKNCHFISQESRVTSPKNNQNDVSPLPFTSENYLKELEAFALKWRQNSTKFLEKYPIPSAQEVKTLLNSLTQNQRGSKRETSPQIFLQPISLSPSLKEVSRLLQKQRKSLFGAIHALRKKYQSQITSNQNTLSNLSTPQIHDSLPPEPVRESLENFIAAKLHNQIMRKKLVEKAKQTFVKEFNPHFNRDLYLGYCTYALMYVLKKATADYPQFAKLFAEKHLENLSHPQSLLATIENIDKKYITEGNTGDPHLHPGDIVIVPTGTDDNGKPLYHSVVLQQKQPEGNLYLSFDNDRISHKLSHNYDCYIIRTDCLLEDIQNGTIKNIRSLEELEQSRQTTKIETNPSPSYLSEIKTTRGR